MTASSEWNAERLDLTQQLAHPVLPHADHDEAARQDFVKSLKLHLATRIAPGNKEIYEERVRPRFERAHGHAPRDRHDVGRVMRRDPYYQVWSSLLRTSQELMWESVGASVARQLPDLIERARGPQGSAEGSLRLDPTLEIPPYHRAVDIHCQPGGYHSEVTEDDVAAGATYDRGVYLYAMGRMGPLNDDIGASLAAYLRDSEAEFQPRRILDLGCSVGHSTIPYVDAYPGAEVHAIDVAAPMLRYAHARAEALGKPLHFSQQNAEATDFPDESFDLIVSHILLHETSAKALPRILRECHRLLRPGGLMLHGEVPQYSGMEPFDAFMLDWDAANNNEPFWGTLHDMDLVARAEEAGFARDRAIQLLVESAFSAAEAQRTRSFRGGDFGGGGRWLAFGAWK